MNAQTLDFNLWPRQMRDQDDVVIASMPSDVDIKRAPIARALLDLRNALILSATKMDYSTNPPKPRAPQQCFTDYDPANPSKDAGNLFKIAITATVDSTGGLSVGVAPLTFSGSGRANRLPETRFQSHLFNRDCRVFKFFGMRQLRNASFQRMQKQRQSAK